MHGSIKMFHDFVKNVDPSQPCHVPRTLSLLIEMEYTWLIYPILMGKFAMSKKYKPQFQLWLRNIKLQLLGCVNNK